MKKINSVPFFIEYVWLVDWLGIVGDSTRFIYYPDGEFHIMNFKVMSANLVGPESPFTRSPEHGRWSKKPNPCVECHPAKRKNSGSFKEAAPLRRQRELCHMTETRLSLLTNDCCGHLPSWTRTRPPLLLSSSAMLSVSPPQTAPDSLPRNSPPCLRTRFRSTTTAQSASFRF